MVRVTSRPIFACGGWALVTVDVEPAAERSVTVAEGFVTMSRNVVDVPDNAEWVAEVTDGAVAGALDALEEHEYRTGPLRVVLVQHVVHPVDSSDYTVRAAAARAVRQAVDLLAPRISPEHAEP